MHVCVCACDNGIDTIVRVVDICIDKKFNCRIWRLLYGLMQLQCKTFHNLENFEFEQTHVGVTNVLEGLSFRVSLMVQFQLSVALKL